MSDVAFERLKPAGSAQTVSAEEYVAGLHWRDRTPPQRPRIIVNFVSTPDGNASFDGRSAPLSDPGDRALFHALRAGADAVMAGTGTLAIERYRPAGRPVVTITRSGRLPLEIPLFSDAAGRAIVFSGAEVDLGAAAADITIEPLTDLASAMATLRDRHDVEVLLCEGGPSLFSALIHAGLVDELMLTLAPKLVGGSAGPAVAHGAPLAELQRLTLTSVLEHDGTLFLRYVCEPTVGA